MHLPWRRPVAAVLLVILAASCGGGGSRSAATSTSTSAAPGTSAAPTTSAGPGTSVTPGTTLSGEQPAAAATVTPDQGVAGTSFTFTVAVRGPGTLGGESVTFGDGGTSGADAGMVPCGSTARTDRTTTYTHVYKTPGTYRFSDGVQLQGPPPACRPTQVTAGLTLVVAAPLSDATLNGAFVTPSQNIACYIDATQMHRVRCASFSPARLVTMDASGSFETCTGSQCDLGNPAMETPSLAYGAATGAGPFQCLSAQAGVTCTVVGHKGFTISRTGVVAVH